MYSTEILSNTVTIREVNSTEIDLVLLKIMQGETQNYAPLQRGAGNSQTNSHYFKNLNWFTYGDFHCHLKVNRNKLALINHRWKCKKGERLTIATNSLTKISQLDGFRPL